MAQKKRRMAESPENRRTVERWFDLDRGICGRPLILTETDGGIGMVAPEFKPRCQERWAREEEAAILHDIVHHEVIRDDWPVEAVANLCWAISTSGYGVEIKHVHPEAASQGDRTAFHIEPPLKDLERDFHKLKPRTFRVDRESTMERMAVLEEVYSDRRAHV